MEVLLHRALQLYSETTHRQRIEASNKSRYLRIMMQGFGNSTGALQRVKDLETSSISGRNTDQAVSHASLPRQKAGYST